VREVCTAGYAKNAKEITRSVEQAKCSCLIFDAYGSIRAEAPISWKHDIFCGCRETRQSAASFAINQNAVRKLLIRMKKILVMTLLFGATGLMSASAADVKESWEKTCAKCHGPDGKGDTKMGQKLAIKDLTDAKLQSELKDEQAFKAIKEGIKDSEGKIKMKPAEGLSDEDIKGLVAHVRTLKK
jgi:cytochrome c553